MIKHKVYELVGKLGISDYCWRRRMNVVFESSLEEKGGYERFESAVEYILKRYRGKSPTRTTNRGVGVKFDKLTDFDKAIEYFRENYGIRQSTQTQGNIGLREDCSRSNISHQIIFVIDILKRHKHEICLETILRT